jgi:imidazolonepropionase-like amidohydrolase
VGDTATSRPRGLALVGSVWPGGFDPLIRDGVVILDAAGAITAIGPLGAVDTGDLPAITPPGAWIGPGVVDAHVHLAFGAPRAVAAGAVTAVRDLGAPPALAAQWRTTQPSADSPYVAVAGPIITAPGGYPSRGWGRDGFAAFVADAAEACAVVASMVGEVDVIKVALEPTGGPVLAPDVLGSVVQAAHEAGLGVTAHALTVATVRAALAAGVDELAHTPIELLPPELVDAAAASDVLVVSTVQTFVDGGGHAGANATANLTALHAAGVRVCYGTDLGNTGTRPGVDVRELRRLADAGLGAWGALRAATAVSARASGMRCASGLVVGEPANLVVLPSDPVADADSWERPIAVVVGGEVVSRSAPDGRA